jgi:hypothetical protein
MTSTPPLGRENTNEEIETIKIEGTEDTEGIEGIRLNPGQASSSKN